MRYHRAMLAADLDARLDEWRRWCLAGNRHRGKCGSAEGDYKSPQRNMWEAPVSSLQTAPIAWRAYQVEVVVTAMPDPFRFVLTLHYIRCAHFATIRRICRRRFRVNDHRPVLDEAKQRVAMALDGSVRPRSQAPSYPRLSAHV